MPSITRKAAGGVRAQRARDEIRRKMLTAVEEMLSEGETFTELSVERLVARAGVARSTFYVYFADKGELLRAWLRRHHRGPRLGGQTPAGNLGADARREDLREALGAVVDVYRPHTSLMAAAFDAAAYDPAVRESVMSLIGHNSAGLRKHIRAGQRDGFVDGDVAAGEVAEWLTWMAERGLHQLVRGADDAAYAKLLDGYTAIIWNTLYAGAVCRRA